MVTRPSEERSIWGIETASKVKACAVGRSANSVDMPAAAGPYNEEAFIVWGATTGSRGIETPVGWGMEGSRSEASVGDALGRVSLRIQEAAGLNAWNERNVIRNVA